LQRERVCSGGVRIRWRAGEGGTRRPPGFKSLPLRCLSRIPTPERAAAPYISVMEMNLLDDGGWLPRSWPPEHPGFEWRRKRIAGEHLGASLYALPPGEATFPYHYELGNDELLVVIAGTPTLRSTEGERQLKPGDCFLF